LLGERVLLAQLNRPVRCQHPAEVERYYREYLLFPKLDHEPVLTQMEQTLNELGDRNLVSPFQSPVAPASPARANTS
jgi:hypothetical protein